MAEVTPPYEMEPHHKARSNMLLTEMVGIHRYHLRQEAVDILRMQAYQAVLLKDLLFVVNELLIYRQQEVHK